MANYWLHQWKVTTWKDQALSQDTTLDHTASNDFEKVAPDDIVFVVAVFDGQLHLAGGIHVAEVLTHDEARRRIGNDLWNADWHLKGHDTSEKVDFDRVVPLDVVRGLRLINAQGRVVPPKFEGPKQDKVHRQTFRNVRRLTAESAARLQRFIEDGR